MEYHSHLGKITLLHKAAASGDVDKVRELLEGGKYDVYCVDLLGRTPLHWAVDNGHMGVVRVLVSEFQADINKFYGGETLLHKAADKDHLDVVRVLVSECKANVNVRNDYGDTPLHLAVRKCHSDVIRVLSEFKADVNVCNNHGDTPLHLAAKGDQFDVVRMLVSEFQADVNACKFHNGETLLYWAASEGHFDVVRVLSKFKTDVNEGNDNGDTPLHVAAKGGHLGVVRVLVKADVNAHNNSGETPLHWAARWGHLDVVRVLVSEFKADVNAHNNGGETPMDIAVSNKKQEVAVILMNEFHCDTKGGTPYIRTACERGWVNLVLALVKQHGTGILKEDVNDNGNKLFDMALNNSSEEVAIALMNEFHCDTKGGTPYIHTACEKGLVKLVRALVQKHGSGILTARDDEGNTPLHVAALNGREDVVPSLINEFSCNVHVTGHLGRSLLHSACASNNSSLVRFVSRHISPWVVDDNGDTPLHICARLRNKYCVKALLEVNPPVMIRNKLGQTPWDLEVMQIKKYWWYTDNSIKTYMKENKSKIHSQYEVVQRLAKKKYSHSEPITRAFVLGNPGAGKSSLVESLKREGLLDSFLGCLNPLFLHTLLV